MFCSICLDNDIELNCGIESCKHRFHFDCIKKWSGVQNTCPECREKFNKILKDEGEIEEVKDKKQVSDDMEFIWQIAETDIAMQLYFNTMLNREELCNCLHCRFIRTSRNVAQQSRSSRFDPPLYLSTFNERFSEPFVTRQPGGFTLLSHPPLQRNNIESPWANFISGPSVIYRNPRLPSNGNVESFGLLFQ